eukprot:g37883.t1
MVQTKFGQIADFRFSDDEGQDCSYQWACVYNLGNTSKEAIGRTLASRYDRTGERRHLLFSDKAGNTEWCKDFTTDEVTASSMISLSISLSLSLWRQVNPPTSRDPPTLRDYSISFPTSERLFHSDNVSLPALPNPPAESRAKNFSVSEKNYLNSPQNIIRRNTLQTKTSTGTCLPIFTPWLVGIVITRQDIKISTKESKRV